LIAILSLPIDILSHLEVYEKPEHKIRLRWLFGLLKKDIKTKKKSPEKKAAKKKGKPKPGEGRKRLWAAFKILRIKGMPGRLARLAKAILSSFKIKELRMNFRVGLDDPADTAFVVGIIDFIRLFWKPSFPHDIDIRADYNGEVALVEGYSHLTVRVLPIRIIVLLSGFLFSWSTIKAVRIMVKAR
jgi:hypothetical protein